MRDIFAAPAERVIRGHAPLAAVAPQEVGEGVKIAQH